jgi:hypothetical protein
MFDIAGGNPADCDPVVPVIGLVAGGTYFAVEARR